MHRSFYFLHKFTVFIKSIFKNKIIVFVLSGIKLFFYFHCSSVFKQLYFIFNFKNTLELFHFLRSDTANSEDRPISIFVNFFFLCNLEFLYFSVLTRSSLFCVLNTIYYMVLNWLVKSAGYAAQTWVARPF